MRLTEGAKNEIEKIAAAQAREGFLQQILNSPDAAKMTAQANADLYIWNGSSLLWKANNQPVYDPETLAEIREFYKAFAGGVLLRPTEEEALRQRGPLPTIPSDVLSAAAGGKLTQRASLIKLVGSEHADQLIEQEKARLKQPTNEQASSNPWSNHPMWVTNTPAGPKFNARAISEQGKICRQHPDGVRGAARIAESAQSFLGASGPGQKKLNASRSAAPWRLRT